MSDHPMAFPTRRATFRVWANLAPVFAGKAAHAFARGDGWGIGRAAGFVERAAIGSDGAWWTDVSAVTLVGSRCDAQYGYLDFTFAPRHDYLVGLPPGSVPVVPPRDQAPIFELSDAAHALLEGLR